MYLKYSKRKHCLLGIGIFGISLSAYGTELIDVPADFQSIQEAVDALPDNGESSNIYLAPGVYQENLDLSGKNVMIIGNPFDPGTVVIDGNGERSSVLLSEREEDYLVTLLGVTITGGTGDIGHPCLDHSYGGGLHLETGTSIQIRNSVVRDNSSWYGGGLYAGSDSRVELVNSVVSGNNAVYNGGGICSLGELFIDGCLFEQNESFDGGHLMFVGKALRETVVQNSMFRNGFALNNGSRADPRKEPRGGAILAQSKNGQVIIRSCTFDRNFSDGLGGAIVMIPFLFDQDDDPCVSGPSFCPTGTLVLEDCTFTNCVAEVGGGVAWHQHGQLLGSRLAFDSCVARTGAGIHTFQGVHEIKESTFLNCGTLLGGHGAGIACEFSVLELFDSSIERCMAHEGVGGGISLVDSTIYMRDCLLRANESEGPGSGLYALRSTVHDQRSEFNNHVTSTAVFLDMESSNRSSEFSWTLFKRNGYYAAAGASRGAVALQRDRGEEGSFQPICRFIGCDFDRNEAAINGGAAIQTNGMDVEVKGGSFLSNNTLSGWADGGAINVFDATISITSAAFERNIASRNGGAVQLTQANCQIRSCDFISNYAENYGGSIESNDSSVLVVEQSTFVGGSSTSAVYGGAIDIDVSAGSAWFLGVSISGCSADLKGGGVFSDGPDTRFTQCRISGNSAPQGGGVGSLGHSSLIEHSRICGNSLDQVMDPYEDGGGNVIAEICCDADLNGDGLVDGADLALLLSGFGSDGSGIFGSDIDGDGLVDGADLTILLGGWGGCN